MADRSVNIILSAKDAASGAFASVRGSLAGMRQEVGRASGAVGLLNKGLIAVGAIGGIATGLKELFTGSGDAVDRIQKGIEALPFGIGQAASLGRTLYDTFSGAADEAERMAKALTLARSQGQADIASTERAARAEEQLRALQAKTPFDRIREQSAAKRGQINREIDATEQNIGGPIASTQRERAARIAVVNEEERQALAKERKAELDQRKQASEQWAKEMEQQAGNFFGKIGSFFGGAAKRKEEIDKANEPPMVKAEAERRQSPRQDLVAREASLLRTSPGGNTRADELASAAKQQVKQTEEQTRTLRDILRTLRDMGTGGGALTAAPGI